jgi:hypothetical protein
MIFAGNFVNVVGPLFVMEVDASESPKLRDFTIPKTIEVDYLNGSLLVLCLLCCCEYEANREVIFLSDNVGDGKRLIRAVLSVPL